MSFIFYFAVLIVSGATVLFGLDLMTSPLPPSRPQTEAASSRAPNKLAQREADRNEEARQALAADDRALSPVYPTAAAESGKDVRMVYPPTNDTTTNDTAVKPVETTGSATADSSSVRQSEHAVQPTVSPSREQPIPAPAPSQSRPATTVGTTLDTPANDMPAVRPVTQQSSVTQQGAGRCNINACAAAYSSFRASDCTYQPYSGSRRVCEKPTSGEQQRAVEHAPRNYDVRFDRETRDSRQARRDVDLRAVEKRVRELTSRDDDDDFTYVTPNRGRRVIVIEHGYADRTYDED